MDNNKVLVYVEDDVTSREVMAILLRDVMGITGAVILDDSTDIITKLNALPAKPDLILLDIHMQPMDGFAILKKLRENEQYQKTRVVAVTASVMNEEVALLKKAGFDGGIAKPIRFDKFPELLQRLLQGENVWYIV